LLAARNTSSQTSTNSNSSGSVGVSYSAAGWGFSVSGSKGKGSSDGSDTSFANTNIQAGNTATIQSGGDTTLKGAVVAANTVKANVGGNLKIESLQDTSTYTSKQSSAGASVSFGGGSVTGGGISANKSNIDSNFASVGQQSSIKAGDGGFQVAVNNNTDLKGSVIASTQGAVDSGKNTFTTGGALTTSDIQNRASYRGDAAGVDVNVGEQAGKFGLSGVGAGIGSNKGAASSTSASGISGIAGNTAVRSTDAPTGIKPIFDADIVQKEINAQMQITQAFSREAPKAIEDFSAKKAAEIKAQIGKETDPQRRAELESEFKKWSSPGGYASAMNFIATALSGGLAGVISAVSKEALATAADEMRQAMIEDSKKSPGICDSSGNCLDNKSGKSAGVNGDNFKLAGGRVSLDLICGSDNERCAKKEDGKSLKLNDDGTVRFTGGDLNKFLEENPAARSPMGGWQGAIGQLTPLGDYAPGSLADKLAEAYSGTHDALNSLTWYGTDGSTKRGMSDSEKSAGEFLNKANVLLATPFGMATFLPPEVWNAISIGLKASR
jgi:filamentous hemagglutinin